MYEQHPVVDDAPARLHRVLPLAAYRHTGKHATQRPAGHGVDAPLPLVVHAPLHGWCHDARSVDAHSLYPSFPSDEEDAPAGHRLVGRRFVGLAAAGGSLLFLLWRVLQLAGQSGDACLGALHPVHIIYMYRAHASHPTPLSGAEDVDIPSSGSYSAAYFPGRDAAVLGACVGRNLPGGGDALRRDGQRPVGLGCFGGHSGRVCLCLVVDARAPVQLSASTHGGHFGTGGIPAGLLFAHDACTAHFATLSAHCLAWFWLCGT